MQNPDLGPYGPDAPVALPIPAVAVGGSRQELRPSAVWRLTSLTIAAIGMYFWKTEGDLVNVLFTTSATLTIGAIIVLIGRRGLVATVLVAAFVAIVVAVAATKKQNMNMSLHAYDFVFYFSSWSTVTYLWYDYRRYMLALITAFAAAGLAAWAAHRVDGTRICRRHAAAATGILGCIAVLATAAKGERRHTLFYFEDLYVSSFFSSWSETVETLWRGQLIETAGRGFAAKLTVPTACEKAVKPPHIILIHQESIVPPSHFPSLDYDRSLDPLFRSFDGRLHRLRVETYGGASWLTEFALLTGL